MKTLVSSKNLHGLSVYSDSGGILGDVDELYFDDRSWSVRYFVLEVGRWLNNRKVLISPLALRGVDWKNGRIRVNATREQIEKSPDASTDLPVARSLELQIRRHYGWGMTWPESFLGSKDGVAPGGGRTYDPHLRSMRMLTGTTLVDGDGEALGTISDFLVDPETWRIEFVAAEGSKVRSVLLAPTVIYGIDMTRREIHVDQTAA
jgi:sporulation protein YlmC with PRC-barrel domain